MILIISYICIAFLLCAVFFKAGICDMIIYEEGDKDTKCQGKTLKQIKKS
jgi:hypothetical protein